MTRNVPALVIGGGISGLACAYSLRKSGVAAQLVEAAPRPGGVIQSASRDGFLFELGPQSFSGTTALRELCTDLGIAAQLLVAPPRAPRYLLIDGHLCPAPLSPPAFFLSGLFDFSSKFTLIRDIFGKTTPPDSDESIADFVRRKFSGQILERLVGPFVSGVYAGDPARLSLRSSFPMLHEAEKSSGSLVRGMLRIAKQKKGPRERPTLQTFREGNETLVRALAAKLGDGLHTDSRVKEISAQSDRSYLVQLETRGGAESISAKSVIFAVPTSVAASLLSPLDPLFGSALNPIEYAPVAVVSLGYSKADVGHSLDGFGFLIPRSAGLRILGCVWNSSLFPGRAPEGHALLTSFVGGATDPAAAKFSPQELTTLVHRELAPLLSLKSDPVFSNANVWPRALPQYNLGHSSRLAELASTRSRFPGLFFTGNYLQGPAIGSCLDQALATSSEVLQHLHS